jgi:hypothetical protein
MSLKNVKKGDKVILVGFTGMKLGIFEVAKASAKSIMIKKRNGDAMIFSKKTGKQTNMDEDKKNYLNSVMIDDGSYVPPKRGKRKKAKKEDETKLKKAAKKKKEVFEEDDIDDWEDDDFEDDDFEDDDEETPF